MGDSGGAAENIATVLASIVAVSLVLTQVLGGLVVYLVEAIKATGKVKEGYSGLVALVVGMGLGMGLGGLTDRMADDGFSLTTMLLMGAFAGALMAAGAVKTYKAMGEVNPKHSEIVVDASQLDLEAMGITSQPDEIDEAVSLYQDLKTEYAATNQALWNMSAPRPEGSPESVPAPPLEPVISPLESQPPAGPLINRLD